MPKFESLLSQLPLGGIPLDVDLEKSAGVESPDEQQHEQDFGRLAYSFLQDRAPALVQYLLGFEVVDRDEDGARAIGIFGFKIGGSYYYVPAFFVNNQIKGMDMLFSKRTNMFMPLQESWVNYVVNRQTIELGAGEERDSKLERDFEQPNFDFLVRPPEGAQGMGKRGAATEIAVDGFDAWNQMQSVMVQFLEKDAEFQAGLAACVAKLAGEVLETVKTAEDSSLLAWMKNKGGPQAVSCLMSKMASSPSFANAALTFYPDVESMFVAKFAAELAPEKKATKVSILTEVTDYMDGEAKKRLVRDGFVIEDGREDGEKSETYEIDYEKRFSSPDRSGAYDVLLRSGGTARAWVFMPSDTAKCNACVVITPNHEACFLAEPGAVYVRGDEASLADPTDEQENIYEKAIELKDILPGKKYILVSKNLDATTPFTVKAVISENDKRVRFRISNVYMTKHKRPTYGHDFGMLNKHRSYDGECALECGDADFLEIGDFEGGNLRASGKDTYVVPKNWKAVELLTDLPKGKDNYEAQRAREDAFVPGSLNDVLEALSKNAFHKLSVHSDDGMEYYMRFDKDFVDGKPMNYKAAAVRLVQHYGLTPQDTDSMLKEANSKFKSRRMIKLGQLAGVSMGYPTEQPMSQDDFTGAQMEYPHTSYVDGQMTGVTPPQDSVQPGFNLGGQTEMDLEASGLAEQAAAAGQKQVFDHSTIGGLAKLYDTTAVIDSYIPDLLKSLDRLGRILFLFYWKNEEFAERYGTEEMTDMEDMLRGVFKSFGDLVIKLKQKAIDSEEANVGVI